MSQWKIDPAGVNAVFTAARTQAGELGKALAEDKFKSIFSGLTWGGAITQDVQAAVQNVFTDQRNNLTNISNRVSAGLKGIVEATNAYARGQEEMAQTHQSAMFDAVKPKPPATGGGRVMMSVE